MIRRPHGGKARIAAMSTPDKGDHVPAFLGSRLGAWNLVVLQDNVRNPVRSRNLGGRLLLSQGSNHV